MNGKKLIIMYEDSFKVVPENLCGKDNGENTPALDADGEPVAAADLLASINCGDISTVSGGGSISAFAIQINDNEAAIVTIGGQDGFSFRVIHDPDTGKYTTEKGSEDVTFTGEGVKAAFSEFIKGANGHVAPAVSVDESGKCTVSFSYALTKAWNPDKAGGCGNDVNAHAGKRPAMSLVVDVIDSAGEDKAAGTLIFVICDDCRACMDTGIQSVQPDGK